MLIITIIILRFFKKPIHNDLVELVLKRVKCMLGYPESKPDLISPNSVLYRYVRSFICTYLHHQIHKYAFTQTQLKKYRE